MAFALLGSRENPPAENALSTTKSIQDQEPKCLEKSFGVLAQPGQMVQKDQPLAVMEAMKMENEIRATQTGNVVQV